MIQTPIYTGWALSLFFALVALLKWKYRRGEAERRISRGLRAYTTAGQTCQTCETDASLVA
jgi:hypothetical protein